MSRWLRNLSHLVPAAQAVPRCRLSQTLRKLVLGERRLSIAAQKAAHSILTKQASTSKAV